MYWSRVLKLNVLRVTLFIEFCEMFWTQGRGPSLRLGTLRCCAVDILKLRCECGFMSVYQHSLSLHLTPSAAPRGGGFITCR